MDLLRAIQTHEARIDGKSFPAPPASVRTALTLLATAEAAAGGDRDSLSTFREAARSWLPRPVFQRLFPAGLWKLRCWAAPPGLGVQMTMQLLMLGHADRAAEAPHEEKPAAEVEWSQMLAEYCNAYGVNPVKALETPWHLFLQMLLAADSVHAKAMLRWLTAKGLPYIENEREREKALLDLQKRAGAAPPEPTEEARLAAQKANLERLEHMLRPLA